MELFHVHPARVAREVSLPADPRARALFYAAAALVAVRGLMAVLLPPAFDETYYWLWSRDLAWSYLDHPPMVAYVIRAGTLLFGDTLAGIRVGTWVLSAVSSYLVWRAAALLLNDERQAARAVLYYNLTLMVSVQAFAATPDAPAMAASSLMLYALARLRKDGNPHWWWAVGLAGGIGLLSKYTALFLGAGVLLWLFTAEGKRWRASFYPYAAAALGLLLFLPVVLWNAAHEWISFEKQFGRAAGGGGVTLKYLGEFLAGQLALATPFIAILGVAGLSRAFRRRMPYHAALLLLFCLIAPSMIYFLFHALQARVQGNWPSFLYPAFAIAAAIDFGSGRALALVRRAAIPFASAVLAVVYLHALTGALPLGARDPLARLMAIGFSPVAERIESLRSADQAHVVLTTSYAPTGWLAFYMPEAKIIQINERERYLAAPAPTLETFSGTMLYVTEEWRDKADLLRARFGQVDEIARLPRGRGIAIFETYVVYRVSGPKGPVLGD
jgi:4-amino-4-deoxy-L-arabinose transferase-like glycosyltransferase